MKKYNIGILGATGAVGREMIKVLEERKFPVGELRLLASERSVGKKVPFCGKEITVSLADFGSFEGLDFVLGASANAVAKKFAPDIVKSGAVFIDNSSAFRMDENVPLVVPEINPEDAKKNNENNLLFIDSFTLVRLNIYLHITLSLISYLLWIFCFCA